MKFPIAKALVARFGERNGKLIREVWNTRHEGASPRQILDRISPILDGFGVERIEAGHNAKSPAILYVNMGDAYTTTILYVRGNFQIGDWGYYVERGNYD